MKGLEESKYQEDFSPVYLNIHIEIRGSVIPSWVMPMVMDIVERSKYLERIDFSYIPKVFNNELAHQLTKFNFANKVNFEWFEYG